MRVANHWGEPAINGNDLLAWLKVYEAELLNDERDNVMNIIKTLEQALTDQGFIV